MVPVMLELSDTDDDVDAVVDVPMAVVAGGIDEAALGGPAAAWDIAWELAAVTTLELDCAGEGGLDAWDDPPTAAKRSVCAPSMKPYFPLSGRGQLVSGA